MHRRQPERRRHRPGALALALLAGALGARPAAADTFSIAAVDVETGQIGSAGASCVGQSRFFPDGAFVLSDILPGIGVIHTQASYVAANQRNARARMLEGLAPEAVVAWLAANDVQGDPGPRQYGIVDLRRGGQSAAYTGPTCTDHKGHRTGPGYSIQGNILAGPEILDGMQAAFVEGRGELAERLMAALEAAKVVGADTRCAARGTSSQSAFIRVLRPQDGTAAYLWLVVPDTPPGEDPIDRLRADFDAWRLAPTVTPGPSLTPPPSPTPDMGPPPSATSPPARTSTAPPPAPSASPTPSPPPLYLPRLLAPRLGLARLRHALARRIAPAGRPGR